MEYNRDSEVTSNAGKSSPKTSNWNDSHVLLRLSQVVFEFLINECRYNYSQWNFYDLIRQILWLEERS